jgi:hypothetical protein
MKMPTAPIRLRKWKCCLQTHGKHLHVAIERLPMPATSETTDVPKRRGDSMISILRDSGLVTLVNAFSCEPTAQDALLQAWRGGEAELGMLPGVVSTALHRSLDGTRVVNYAQLRSVEDWENLRRIGQMKAYFERTSQFGRPDAHLYEVVYTRGRSGAAA